MNMASGLYTTVSFVDSFDISSQDTLPNGLVFNRMELKCLLLAIKVMILTNIRLLVSMYPQPLLETLASHKILLGRYKI